MKKIMTLIFASVLMGTFCLACDDNKNDEQKIGIRPVIASVEVNDFFDFYLPESNYSRPPHEFDFGNIDELGRVCLVVNTMGEFEAVAPSSVELPSINFDKHTLIIGQWSMGNPGYRLTNQRIDTEPDIMVLYLNYESLGEGGTPGVVTTFYFWGLYPKLPQKPIQFSIQAN
jgi:hypothetical protein